MKSQVKEFCQQKTQISTYEELNLNPLLLRGLADFGYETPTQLQIRAISVVQSEKDCLIVNRQRKNKMITIAIGVLSTINLNVPSCMAIVLSPTRQQAKQFYNQLIKISQHMGIVIRLTLSGSLVRLDRLALRQKNVQILVSTPGRARDFIQRKHLDVCYVTSLTMTDGEQILCRGFGDIIKEIFQQLPFDIFVTIYSQFYSQGLQQITQKFMRDPKVIQNQKKEIKNTDFKNLMIEVNDDNHKFNIISQLQFDSCLIYVNSQARAEELMSRLKTPNLKVDRTNGINLVQKIEHSRFYKILPKSILICADSQEPYTNYGWISPTLIINFEMPKNAHYYEVRSNIGDPLKKKMIVSLVTPQDKDLINILKHVYNIRMESLPIQ